jgi:flavin-dependent dehydrogenase
MIDIVDMVIAGGGPAGLATALYARRAGLSAVVVEPRTAPIDKACGEGLMPHAVTALGELGVFPRGVPIRGIRYLHGRTGAAAAFRRGSGLGTRRVELHRALAAAVSGCGIETVRARVDALTQDDRSVTAAGIRARYLVAADGLHSRVRRLVGVDATQPEPRRWGMRAHFGVQPWTDHVEVHWSAHTEAYVTPVAADCVGVALLGGRGGPFLPRLEAFPALARRLHGVEPGPVLAAGPMRQDVARTVHGRALLVGDAAGYLDALTGEGIAIALACARALVECVATGRPHRYERDYRRATRRYRLITAALLAAAGRPGCRRRIVPTAAAAAPLFSAVVNQLA